MVPFPFCLYYSYVIRNRVQYKWEIMKILVYSQKWWETIRTFLIRFDWNSFRYRVLTKLRYHLCKTTQVWRLVKTKFWILLSYNKKKEIELSWIYSWSRYFLPTWIRIRQWLLGWQVWLDYKLVFLSNWSEYNKNSKLKIEALRRTSLFCPVD